MLAQLQRLGLPVPAPVAARFEREGLLYRADIITARLPNASHWRKRFAADAISDTTWHRIGETIARFHAAGVHHADLNANNIMLDRMLCSCSISIAAEFARAGAWEANVLARLKRSLEKVEDSALDVHFTADDWRTLLAGVSGSERRTVVGGGEEADADSAEEADRG